MRVIFVCYGNTCRSPMAEAIFKSLVSDIEVLSAGMSALDGQKVADNAIKICKFNNLDLNNHKAKNFHELNPESDDLILTLGCDIRDSLRKSYPDLEIYTIKEYAGEKDYLDIKDPFGGDLSIYEMCFFEIKEYLEKIAATFNKKNLESALNIVKDEEEDISARLTALDGIGDEAVLHDMTYYVSSDCINKKIIEKIQNQNLLINLALNHPDYLIRHSVCKKIKDDSILFYMANNDSSYGVRLEAIRRIEDAEILNEILLNTEDNELIIYLIDKLSENEILDDFLRTFNHEGIVEHIRKQEVLEVIACFNCHTDMKIEAIAGILNGKVLENIALNDSEPKVRLHAARKITDEQVLAKLVLHDSDIEVRCLAISKVSDQSLIRTIVLYENNSDLRCAAMSNLEDQSLLEYLALNDCDYEVRVNAVSKIRNSDVLKEIFYNDNDDTIRRIVIKNLNDDKYLEEIAFEFPEYANLILEYISEDYCSVWVCYSDDWRVRRNAIKKIHDESLLRNICCNSRFDDMIFSAISKIRSEEILIEIAYSSPIYYSRRMAVKKIRNKDVLMDLALNDEDPEIRRIASKHI